jgi:uncharacterized protein YndB with AHSA1/START domain
MTVAAEGAVLEIKRIFEATPAEIFDAWMDRERWQAWIGPEGVNCDVTLHEPRVGGRYRFVMNLSDGRTVPVAGMFKAIDPPARFVFTWGWEGEVQQTLVTVTLRDLNGKTELTLRHEGLETLTNNRDHEKGWNSALNKLAAHLATRPQ